jgi:CheY-like chemotaxis protein
MTANAFPEDWARCASVGMCTYLPKPFKRETLRAELNKVYLLNKYIKKKKRGGEEKGK